MPDGTRLSPGAGAATFLIRLYAVLRLKGDLITRYKALQIGIASRFITPNEARRSEGLEAVPGGDVFQESTLQAPAPDEALPGQVKPEGMIQDERGVWRAKPNGHDRPGSQQRPL